MGKRFVSTVLFHYEYNAEDSTEARSKTRLLNSHIENLAGEASCVCTHVQDVRELTPTGDNYMPQEAKERAIDLWTNRVWGPRMTVDAYNQHEWHTLAYGFFLACGFAPSEANLLVAELGRRKLI